MLLAHVAQGLGDLADVALGLLDGGAPVALALPPEDVGLELRVPPLLLLHVLAQLALVLLHVRVEHQLQPARLARAVLLGALLSEVPDGRRGRKRNTNPPGKTPRGFVLFCPLLETARSFACAVLCVLTGRYEMGKGNGSGSRYGSPFK